MTPRTAVSRGVSLLYGRGDGTFGRAIHLAVGPNPFGLALADFDRDGRTDLATGNYSNGTASVLLSSAPRAFILTGTAGDDNWHVKRNGDLLEVRNNADGSGAPVSTHALGEALTLNGLGGDDTVTLDMSGGDVAVGSLTIAGANGTDKVRLTNGDGRTLTLGGLLTLDGEYLDLGTADLRLTGVAPAAAEALLASARAGSTRWQGPGIGTSAATDNTGLIAVARGGDMLVRYSYDGDANGDGSVNADDYFRIDSGFLEQPQDPTYAQGDFNYDGRINADDYFLIDSSFLGQGQPLDSDAAITAMPSIVAAAPRLPAEPERKTARERPARPLFSVRPVTVLVPSRRAGVARRR